jgi:hypothetical protein
MRSTWNSDAAASVMNTECRGWCRERHAPAASVGHSVGERLHAAGFVVTSQAALVAFPVCFDVLFVLQLQLFHVLDDDSIATAFPRALSADVGMAASAIPVPRHRLRVKTAKKSNQISGICTQVFFIKSHQQIARPAVGRRERRRTRT